MPGLIENTTVNEQDTCLSYRIFLSIDRPDVYTVFERYVNRAGLDEIHLKSDAFLAFKAAAGAAGVLVGVKYNHYEESSLGFLVR